MKYLCVIVLVFVVGCSLSEKIESKPSKEPPTPLVDSQRSEEAFVKDLQQMTEEDMEELRIGIEQGSQEFWKEQEKKDLERAKKKAAKEQLTPAQLQELEQMDSNMRVMNENFKKMKETSDLLIEVGNRMIELEKKYPD